ncbi:2-hydroxyacid dehydrogenase [Rhodoferax sp.]|uniref:2-hydroxyacid dehydrogenase n=1 Tax=Rhodoferax sp. TaxID=50421 RepID=UPI00271A0E63|nr:2-hydroxyacid dehydrogenase [Rhodoferax sp.]MDO9145622.1 2-hydroxyacid dehydrogenase [Rhodoferax sp.]
MKPNVLLLSRLPETLIERLRARFDCHEHEQLDAAGLQALAPLLRGMVATGESVVTRELMTRLPALEIISVLGVGYDGIDIEAARERGICVTHTPGLSTEDIADFAMALLLSAARQVASADRFVRRGDWSAGRHPMTQRVFGARLGIVGLGRIGRAVAVRALAFGMRIAYTGRTPKTDVAYRWCDDVLTLAASVDFLVVCASAGPATRALINAEVLAALGPAGVLVNVARGAIVDEDALVQALRERKILAAGLDVFCDEPRVPAGLLGLDNVVLTPHMASTTGATVQAMLELTFDNLAAHFDGLPVSAPVV